MTIYSTVVTSPSTIFNFDTESGNLMVTSSGALIGTGSFDVVVGTEIYIRLTVDGDIISNSARAVHLQGDYSTVTIGASGSILSNSVALNLGGAEFLVNNFGQISGAWGISAYGGSGTINNAGSIIGTSTGDYYYSEAGIFLVDDDDDSVNSVYTINNSGTITGNDYAIFAGEYAYYQYFASDTSIFNTGLLIGGGQGAVFLGLGEDKVVNSGTIVGDVFLGDDADIFDGRGGTVNGAVRGGQGDDTYIVDDAGSLLIEYADEGTDLVEAGVSFALADNFENLALIGAGNIDGTGNSEENELIGNAGHNELRGKGGKDLVIGGDGNDILHGGSGNDILTGGNQNDALYGGGGNDILKGEDGDDSLFGRRGNDTLKGGNGNDILNGGAGLDSLNGGLGDDVFKFTKAAHSTNDANADLIKDFTSGEDLIDLAAFAGTLTFIGTNGFSGAAGEVRTTVLSGDNIVRVDLDGDGSADMKIKVLGVAQLEEADFLL